MIESSSTADTAPRALSARSVLLSVVLGSDPPELPVAWMVRAGALFDLSEGTVRTALTRMTQRGDLTRTSEGWYRLGEEQLLRQARQRESRSAVLPEWNGRWQLATVTADQRSPQSRSQLRRDMALLRFAEQREGVWIRPDNLAPDRLELVRARVGDQTYWYFANPQRDETELAAALWPLRDWIATSERLRKELVFVMEALNHGDQGVMRRGFELSAEVLRHFQKDPLLPRELLPREWPGAKLRSTYSSFDVTYRTALAAWVNE